MSVYYGEWSHPAWGRWVYIHKDGRIISLKSLDNPHISRNFDKKELPEFEASLKRYFSGEFEALRPYQQDALRELEDSRDFKASVYRELISTEIGEKTTYSDIAKKAGAPRASRAVGQACSQNALLLIIPCHRVVPKNKALGVGYYAGGSKLKEKILTYEARAMAGQEGLEPPTS